MASQDSWALPTANRLVNLFRVSSLTYVRMSTAYDPATGTVTPTETVISAAGAVTKMSATSEGGTGGPRELEAWVNLEYLSDIWPTTDDYLRYQDKSWKIISVAPAYAGDVRYAAKLTARAS